MISYFIVISLVVLFCFLAEKTQVKVPLGDGKFEYKKTTYTSIFLFISATLLTCMAGLRYRVGMDYVSYYNMYETYKNFKIKDFLDVLNEPLMPFWGKIASLIYDSPHTMFFLASVATIGILLYGVYNETSDFAFVTALYIFVGCWHSSFNAMRQCLAVTIVFFGRKYITDRKLLKYLLVCFIAFLAHRSAMFCVFFYFVYSKKFSIRKLVIVLIATLFIAFNYEAIFGFIGWLNDAEYILNDYSKRSVNLLRTLVGCVPALVAIYYAVSRKLDKQQIFYVYMIVINAAIRIATSDSAYLYRLAMFPAIFLPLGLGFLTKVCNVKYRKAFRVCTIILYFLYWLYEILINGTLREFEWVFFKTI